MESEHPGDGRADPMGPGRLSFESFHSAFHASPIGMTICDAAGQCTEANDAIGALIGATRQQVLEQNYHQLKSWHDAGLVAQATRALETGATTEGTVALTSTFGRSLTTRVSFVPLTVDSSLRYANHHAPIVAFLMAAVQVIEAPRLLMRGAALAH